MENSCTDIGQENTPPQKPHRSSIENKEDSCENTKPSQDEDGSLTSEEGDWVSSVDKVFPFPDISEEDGVTHNPINFLNLEKRLDDCTNRIVKLENQMQSLSKEYNNSDGEVIIRLDLFRGMCLIEGDKQHYGYVVGRRGATLRNLIMSMNGKVKIEMPPKGDMDRVIKITSEANNQDALIHTMNSIACMLSKK